MEELIKVHDSNLILISTEVVGDIIYMDVESTLIEVRCPYCQAASSRVHSRYTREFQDLPIQNMKTVIRLRNRKMFCPNQECTHKTFAESFSFISPKSKKTNRLIEEIVQLSSKMSSVSAEKYLRAHVVRVGKSTICELLKKGR